MTGKHVAWSPESVLDARKLLIDGRFHLGYVAYAKLMATVNKIAETSPIWRKPNQDEIDSFWVRVGENDGTGLPPLLIHPSAVNLRNELAESIWDDGDTGEVVDDSGTPVDFAPRSAASHASKDLRK